MAKDKKARDAERDSVQNLLQPEGSPVEFGGDNPPENPALSVTADTTRHQVRSDGRTTEVSSDLEDFQEGQRPIHVQADPRAVMSNPQGETPTAAGSMGVSEVAGMQLSPQMMAMAGLGGLPLNMQDMVLDPPQYLELPTTFTYQGTRMGPGRVGFADRRVYEDIRAAMARHEREQQDMERRIQEELFGNGHTQSTLVTAPGNIPMVNAVIGPGGVPVPVPPQAAQEENGSGSGGTPPTGTQTGENPPQP